ncbi:tetratricopeptide repeat protein 32 isoform X3 [Eleutherodactylus coqui]|uniref:tetratricopeptide repeat protein 32 isoform X3 n=1 Tax=Eleutherodactylus coqui TaxID=57060 RepID=UPI003462C26C
MKVPTADPIELSREFLDLLEQNPKWMPKDPIKSRQGRMNIRKPFRAELPAAAQDDPEERYPWMRRARSKKLEEELKKIEKQEALPELE